MTEDPSAKSTLPGGQYSDFRRLAAEYRQRVHEPRPDDISIEEWTALCMGAAQHWDELAEQHEKAIAEGRCFEFLYGDDKPPPP